MINDIPAKWRNECYYDAYRRNTEFEKTEENNLDIQNRLNSSFHKPILRRLEHIVLKGKASAVDRASQSQQL